MVNGTREPQNTFLTDHQQSAVVYLETASGRVVCSGVLIGPKVVATAYHCLEDWDFDTGHVGFGQDINEPDALIPVGKVIPHPDYPDVDFVLLILGFASTDYLPEVVPLPVNRVPLDESWLSRWVDAVGYGDTMSQETGRFFVSVQVFQYDEATVSVDGHGEQGICYGDSGAPVVWQSGAESDPVVVGLEVWGDSSCVDQDHLVRLDVVAEWIDSMTQELPGDLESCSDPTFDRCDGDVHTWCAGGYSRVEDCAAVGSRCGYLGSRHGYGCLHPECGDIDYHGQCDGSTLQWCGSAGLRSRDCTVWDLDCVWLGDGQGYNCGECVECDGQCTDTQVSMEHCGGCNTPCSLAHATGVCTAGICEIDTCDVGFADADGVAATGCEMGADGADGSGCAATGGLPLRGLWVLGVLGILRMFRRCRD